MKKLLIAVLLLVGFIPCFAQVTQRQKVSNFMDLAVLYDKNFGRFHCKIRVFDYDLRLDQVYSAKDDLEFDDIYVRYMASLHDFLDEFTRPSFHEVYLPLTADIYDGKVRVDFVDSTVLEPASYPSSIGDEIVSVDDVSATNWISLLATYAVNNEENPVSRNRLVVASTRTSGGGGNLVSFDTGPYAEGPTRTTESIAVRNHDVLTRWYPNAPFIENIGVYPDLLADDQTKDDRLTGGGTFVAGFSAHGKPDRLAATLG